MTKTAAEKYGLGLITEAEARAEAEAERAAIRAAAPLYSSPAEAKLLQEIEDAREAMAKAAAAARAKLPKSDIPLPEAAPEAELSAAAKAAKATAKFEAARAARELLAEDRAAERAAAARAARIAAVRRSAHLVMAELPEAELDRLTKAASKTEAPKARAARALLAAAADQGVSPAELVAEANADLGRDEIFGAAPEAGQYSVLSPAELAELAARTKAQLATPAAKAGRAALDAMGPNASALVVTKLAARTLTVAKVTGTVDSTKARAKVAELKAEHAKATAALEAAEATEAAAKATKARQPIRAAEANADRIAEARGKIGRKLAKAEAALQAAEIAEARPEAQGKIWQPVAKLKLAEAAKAAELELPVRHDRMPGQFAERGPSAKKLPTLSDNTYRLAMAEIDKLTEAAERAAWQEIYDMIKGMIKAKAEAEAEAKAAESEAYLARRRLAAKVRRRNAKLANR